MVRCEIQTPMKKEYVYCSILDTNRYDDSASGHPALSIPVGFSPAIEDPSVLLPVGLQIVGRKFDELLLLKIAASWEKKYNWKFK